MGLVNWDYRRQQRDSDFRAEGRIVLVAEVVSLIATATAAILLRDFTAILYGLIGRAAMTVIMSHAVARQRYAAGYAREYAPRLARFRSEEHTSELQSLMRTSYAVFCLQKKT